MRYALLFVFFCATACDDDNATAEEGRPPVDCDAVTYACDVSQAPACLPVSTWNNCLTEAGGSPMFPFVLWRLPDGTEQEYPYTDAPPDAGAYSIMERCLPVSPHGGSGAGWANLYSRRDPGVLERIEYRDLQTGLHFAWSCERGARWATVFERYAPEHLAALHCYDPASGVELSCVTLEPLPAGDDT